MPACQASSRAGAAAALRAGTSEVGLIPKRCDRADRIALCYDVAGTVFTAAALRGHAQFPLNLVKAHAGLGMAGNFSVGNTAANADDHGNRPLGPKGAEVNKL